MEDFRFEAQQGPKKKKKKEKRKRWSDEAIKWKEERKKLTCVSCAKLLGPTCFLVVLASITNANAVQASMFGKF